MKKYACLLLVIVILASFGGCGKKEIPTNTDPSGEANQTEQQTEEKYKQSVSLYFSSDNISSLSAEKRMITVEKKEDIYKGAISALIEGPETESLFATVHPNTVVNSVTVTGTTATVDFTDTLKTYNTGGSTKEFLCLYSIVNTLCDFEEIENVVLTENGNAISIFGQLDTSEPLTKE